jgi:transcription elongation factor Elf1
MDCRLQITAESRMPTIRTCPHCKSELVLLPNGKRPRTLQCPNCDQRDPFKSADAFGWLQGELRPPT